FGKVQIVIGCCIIATSFGAVEHDYYWRDYRGTIPDDAFSGAEDLYIAQVVSYWLLPGTFNAKTKEVYTEQGDKVTIRDNFKILCDLHSDNFYWRKVNVHELVGEELEDLVVGGMELNNTLYIGKTFDAGEWKMGKVFPPTHQFKGLRVWSADGGRYVTENFQVLKYRPRHKYQHICDCKFEHINP
ncbi:hypothetical protein Trydic_g18302, partial [Trypoxylus dichotomus]